MKKVLMEHEEENNSMNANTNQSSNDLINSDILYKIRIVKRNHIRFCLVFSLIINLG